jgi:hypothetical protein
MSSFRFCFLDSIGCVTDFHLIECETDSQAQTTRADRLLAAYGYLSIEVWDRGRRVYRAQKKNPALPHLDADCDSATVMM